MIGRRMRFGGWSRAAAACAGVALLVGFGAAAWACSPAASVARIIPEFGPAGTEVTVSGTYYTTQVEIHWATANGPVLATLAGPTFARKVTVPANASPGVYAIVALGRDTDGSIAGQAASTFEVTTPTPTPTASTVPPAPTVTQPDPVATPTNSSTTNGPATQATPSAVQTGVALPAVTGFGAATQESQKQAPAATRSVSTAAPAARPATAPAAVTAVVPPGVPAAVAPVTATPAPAAAAPTAATSAGPDSAPLRQAWNPVGDDHRAGLMAAESSHQSRAVVAGVITLGVGSALLVAVFLGLSTLKRRSEVPDSGTAGER